MALSFFRFRTFGHRPSHPIKIKNLYLHELEDQKGEWVIETIRPVRDRAKAEEQVQRLLELLSIFYLKKINYYHIEQRANSNNDWKWIESRSAIVAFTVKEHPFFEEKDIEEFLRLTFGKKRYEERIRIANALLIAAEVETLVFEARYVLRWMALESLMNAEVKKSTLTEKQFLRVKNAWRKFSEKTKLKSKGIMAIVEERINDAKQGMVFRKKYEKFIQLRKLPIIYNDIKDAKMIRDKIVHTGSFRGLKYGLHECHNFSMQIRSLIRNILMHYLGLEFDQEWKKWYSRRYWRPQKRT